MIVKPYTQKNDFWAPDGDRTGNRFSEYKVSWICLLSCPRQLTTIKVGSPYVYWIAITVTNIITITPPHSLRLKNKFTCHVTPWIWLRNHQSISNIGLDDRSSIILRYFQALIYLTYKLNKKTVNWNEWRLRLRLHQTKFLRIRRQSEDLFFGLKVAVYTEVTNSDKYEPGKKSGYFKSGELRLQRNFLRFCVYRLK